MFKRLHAFHCGTETCSETLFDPQNKAVDAVRQMPYFFYLVEHSLGLVAFDTGPNRDFVRDNVSYLGPAARGWRVAFREGDDARSQLAAIGIDIADVSTVLLSHLHYDHAGGMRDFSNATFFIQKREWEFANNPGPRHTNNYIKSDFDVPESSLRLIEGQYDVFGDNSLVLIPTPGHTPGHQSLLINGMISTYLLAADAVYLSDLDNDACLPGPALAWSQAAMVESRRVLSELRDKKGAMVMCTHDPAFASGPRVPPFGVYD